MSIGDILGGALLAGMLGTSCYVLLRAPLDYILKRQRRRIEKDPHK